MSSDHSGHTSSVKWRLAVFLPNAALRHFNTLWCCQVFQPWEGTFLPESTVWAVPCLSTDDKYSELHFLEWSEKRKSYSSKTVHFAWCMACVWGETDQAARDEQIGESFSVFFSSCTLYCFRLLAHSPQLNSPVWNLLGARAASSAKNLPIAEHWGGAWEKNLWHSCQPNLLNLFGLA